MGSTNNLRRSFISIYKKNVEWSFFTPNEIFKKARKHYFCLILKTQ